MAEVLSEEYGTRIAEKAVSIFSQTGDDLHECVDRAILRKTPGFPHARINSPERLEELGGYIEWARNRIQGLALPDYKPYLHYEVYATLGMKYDNDIRKMVEHLKMWKDLANPYKLIIDEPFDMG